MNLARTPRAYKFSSKLFEFPLQDANVIFNENKENININNKMQTGFGQFINCLDEYLELLDDPMITDECQIRIYGSVTLENGTIMRATNSYHDRAWFSDVAILMDSEESNEYISDQGICYGQVTNFCVLIILTIIYFNF